jgi:hypothetical protein
MTEARIRVGGVRSIVVASLLAIAGQSLAVENTVQAMASWQGSGEVFVVAPDKLMLLVSFTGIMYLQEKSGALDDVVMVCPAVQTLDTKSKHAEATGHCTFAAAGGELIYSTWKCAGVQGVCEGELTLTGGTGKFAGITGGGKMAVRAALSQTALSLSSGGVVKGAAGLAVWPALKYTIPAK